MCECTFRKITRIQRKSQRICHQITNYNAIRLQITKHQIWWVNFSIYIFRGWRLRRYFCFVNWTRAIVVCYLMRRIIVHTRKSHRHKNKKRTLLFPNEAIIFFRKVFSDKLLLRSIRIFNLTVIIDETLCENQSRTQKNRRKDHCNCSSFPNGWYVSQIRFVHAVAWAFCRNVFNPVKAT